jgi:hypothetical protein
MTRKKGKGIKEKNKTSTTKKGATPLLGFTSAESSPKVPHSRDPNPIGVVETRHPWGMESSRCKFSVRTLSYTAVFVLLVKEKSLF